MTDVLAIQIAALAHASGPFKTEEVTFGAPPGLGKISYLLDLLGATPALFVIGHPAMRRVVGHYVGEKNSDVLIVKRMRIPEYRPVAIICESLRKFPLEKIIDAHPPRLVIRLDWCPIRRTHAHQL